MHVWVAKLFGNTCNVLKHVQQAMHLCPTCDSKLGWQLSSCGMLCRLSGCIGNNKRVPRVQDNKAIYHRCNFSCSLITLTHTLDVIEIVTLLEITISVINKCVISIALSQMATNKR